MYKINTIRKMITEKFSSIKMTTMCKCAWQNKWSLLLCFLLLVVPTLQDAEQFEQYEPSKNVCKGRCDCIRSNDTLLINCTGRGMTNVLETWPPHSARLIASFNKNNITELKPLPPSDAHVISVSFRQCAIRKLKTQLFIDAYGIQFLDLSWNYLTGEEFQAEVFRGRYSNEAYEAIGLEELILSHNNIESLRYSVFEHTPNLTHLDLSYNPLRIIDPQISHAISSNIRLMVLNLSNTSIAKLPENALSRLQKLRELDLSNNLFKKVPDSLSYLTQSLQILTLDNNPILHLDDNAFMGLNALRALYVNDMKELKTIRHNTFSKLYNLRAVHCTNNKKLHHIHHEAFGIEANRPPLEELYISDNNLQTLAQHLLDWSNVTQLDLAGNRWFCECKLYHTILEINSTNPEIESPAASCSEPAWAAGYKLFDLEALNRSCLYINATTPHTYHAGRVYSYFTKTILVIISIFLTLVAAFFFYKIVTKYKNVRSFNTSYPVMYISAPTTEN